jgi:acyl-CoA reductase-like NAD-dependent aldehyde dehydrogenase
MATVEQATSTNGATTDATFPVENPATGEVIATLPDMSAEQVHEMALKARAVQPAWEALGFEGRARVFLRMQKWSADNSERVIDVVMSETGKSYEDAQISDWATLLSTTGFWAKTAEKYLAEERVSSSSVMVKGKKLMLRYRPLGLIGVIGPWNYPLANSFCDAIPALMAGNSVIIKPSEITPLSTLLMEDAARECGMPDGVFQTATGLGATGAALVDEVDMIMFTGSTATGKKVMQKAAETLTPVSLELGGKDPMIVLADADIERAANHAAYYANLNAGQTCISVERVYVEAPVYDEFVGKVAEKVRAIRQGVPGGAGSVDMGSITFPKQVDIIDSHVEDAKAKGARAIVGGAKGHDGEGGYWYQPTVLVDVDHSMKCMTEETFGPTLPIMKVADAEEAIKMANDSPYGLAASVFGKDLARAEAVARRVESGAVCVNDALINYAATELPMGGWKSSGLGSRHGAGGIRKYCRQQALMVSRFHMKKDAHMYPYNAKMTGRLQKMLKLVYARGKRA